MCPTGYFQFHRWVRRNPPSPPFGGHSSMRGTSNSCFVLLRVLLPQRRMHCLSKVPSITRTGIYTPLLNVAGPKVSPPNGTSSTAGFPKSGAPPLWRIYVRTDRTRSQSLVTLNFAFLDRCAGHSRLSCLFPILLYEAICLPPNPSSSRLYPLPSLLQFCRVHVYFSLRTHSFFPYLSECSSGLNGLLFFFFFWE